MKFSTERLNKYNINFLKITETVLFMYFEIYRKQFRIKTPAYFNTH